MLLLEHVLHTCLCTHTSNTLPLSQKAVPLGASFSEFCLLPFPPLQKPSPCPILLLVCLFIYYFYCFGVNASNLKSHLFILSFKCQFPPCPRLDVCGSGQPSVQHQADFIWPADIDDPFSWRVTCNELITIPSSPSVFSLHRICTEIVDTGCEELWGWKATSWEQSIELYQICANVCFFLT